MKELISLHRLVPHRQDSKPEGKHGPLLIIVMDSEDMRGTSFKKSPKSLWDTGGENVENTQTSRQRGSESNPGPFCSEGTM